MIKTTRLLMATVALCGFALSAQAADLSQPRIINYPAPEVSTGGWYLRGDVGVGITNQSSFYETAINNQACACTTTGWLNKSINNSTNIDVGVGYQYSDNLRGDVTLQYRASTAFQGGNFISNPNNNPTTGENSITGSVSSVVGMVNGYYDVTKWNGLSPFVGAGIGFAANQLRATSTGGGGISDYGVYGSKNQTNFAWALHAGLSYEINPRLKLELGYSFMNLGDVKSGSLTCYGKTGQTCGGGGEIFKINRMTSNDVHIGMRWQFDAPAASSYQSASWQQQPAPVYQPTYAPAPVYSSAPVTAKY